MASLLLLGGCWRGPALPQPDPGTAPAPALAVLPAAPSIPVGQPLVFRVQGLPSDQVSWSVKPAAGASIQADGTFLATQPGLFTVEAFWSLDPRVCASVPVSVLAPAPGAQASPDVVMAHGAIQTGRGGFRDNHAILGEPTPALAILSPSGSRAVRHGFYPGAESVRPPRTR